MADDKYISTHTGTEIDDAITKLSTMETNISDMLSTVRSMQLTVNLLSSSVNGEKATRETNDNNEAKARKNADSNLQAAIEEEAETRESEAAIIEELATQARNYPAPRFNGFVAGVTVQTASISNPTRIVFDTTAKKFYASNSLVSGSLGKVYANWPTRTLYDNEGTSIDGKIFIGPSLQSEGAEALYVYDSTEGLIEIGFTGIVHLIRTLIAQQSVSLTDTTTTTPVNDATAKNWFKSVFDNQTGDDTVSCVSARILDLDRTNRTAVVRYTMQTDINDIFVYMNGVCIGGCRPDSNFGYVCVVVNVPYNASGSANPYGGKYTLK